MFCVNYSYYSHDQIWDISVVPHVLSVIGLISFFGLPALWVKPAWSHFLLGTWTGISPCFLFKCSHLQNGDTNKHLLELLRKVKAMCAQCLGLRKSSAVIFVTSHGGFSF